LLRLSEDLPHDWQEQRRSDEILDIRRLENRLERLGGGSRPTTPPLASLVAIDAFT
jgi:hypothetical protein